MSLLDKFDSSDISIIKHNALIESGGELSPTNHNLMTLAVAKAKKRQVAERRDLIMITADEYARIHGITNSVAYRNLKKGVLELRSASLLCDGYVNLTPDQFEVAKSYNIEHFNGYSKIVSPSKYKDKERPTDVKVKILVNIFSSVSYSDDYGFVTLQFDSDMLRLIDDSVKDYTEYNYKDTIPLRGTPAKQLFEICSKWQDLGKVTKTVDDWKILFGVLDKYEKTAEFKRWILLPAIDNINEVEDNPFKLSLEAVKAGRVIIGFTINIIKKKQKTNKKEQKKLPELANHKPSWQIKGLSDSQINKIKVFTKDFVDVNTSKISPTDRRDYPEIFESWRPLLKSPETVNTFHKIQELLERSHN